MRSYKILLFGLVSFMLLIGSCTTQDNYIFTTTKESGKNKTYSYEIKSLGHQHLQIFEVTMRLSFIDSYSGENFTLVDYKKIHQLEYDNLTALDIESLNNKEYSLVINKAGRYSIKFPKGSKSHGPKVILKKGRACYSDFNELMRLEYNLPDSEFPESKFIKMIGVRNYSDIENLDFNLDYFFKNGDNLFNMYRNSFNCDFNWKVKYEEK